MLFRSRGNLREGGVLIAPDAIDERALRSKKALNVAMLGILSRRLEIPEDAWMAALRAELPEKLLDVNLEAFAIGRKA